MSDTDPPGENRELTELKLRALAELAAGAGHEINNPVATIVGYAQQLLADEHDPDRRHALFTIGAQAYRIRDMIGDLMLFARPPAPKPQTSELAEAIREVAAKFADELGAAGIRLNLATRAPVPIFADPVQLRVVVSNLLRNSLEASARGGTITISADVAEEAGHPVAVLAVSDTGRGLSGTEREHLFDPFYSGRQAGRGLGFGLPKAWRIVTQHGGRIEVESPESGGVKFTVVWPATMGERPSS